MKHYALGSEINEFYNNHFPEGFYCDDMSDTIQCDNSLWLGETKLNLKPTEKYDLDDLGVVVRKSDDVYWDFSEKFLEWQDKQNFVTFVVKAPKKQSVQIKGYIQAIDSGIEFLEAE